MGRTGNVPNKNSLCDAKDARQLYALAGKTMYRRSFPKCPVQGDASPKSYSCMASNGSIPGKCIHCEYQFEASCTRHLDMADDYQVLDAGP